MDARVMIVDDNPWVRDAVETLLRTKGIDAVTASGGCECLSQLEAGFRGVLLMDLVMPGMDGWETIGQIAARGLHEGNIILIFSASGGSDARMEAVKGYVTGYLTKPFDSIQLLETIRRYASLLKVGGAGAFPETDFC